MCLWMLMVSLLTGAEGCPCDSYTVSGLSSSINGKYVYSSLVGGYPAYAKADGKCIRVRDDVNWGVTETCTSTAAWASAARGTTTQPCQVGASSWLRWDGSAWVSAPGAVSCSAPVCRHSSCNTDCGQQGSKMNTSPTPVATSDMCYNCYSVGGAGGNNCPSGHFSSDNGWSTDDCCHQHTCPVCPSPPTSPPPTPPTIPPFPPLSSSLFNSKWSVDSGSAYCQVTSGGWCVTDGPGNYGNSEQCTFRAVSDMIVTTPQYDVERSYDYLKLNLCSNVCGTSNNGVCEDGGTGATSSTCSLGTE
jgi:hypothetical protein